jgi:CRISPR-associated protein Cas2
MSASERDFYVLAYDIHDDKRRVKIAKLMESMGARVQGSVFEAYLTQKELEALTRKAARLMRKEQDSLRVYYLCRACLEKVKTHGQGQLTPAPGLMIV